MTISWIFQDEYCMGQRKLHLQYHSWPLKVIHLSCRCCGFDGKRRSVGWFCMFNVGALVGASNTILTNKTFNDTKRRVGGASQLLWRNNQSWVGVESRWPAAHTQRKHETCKRPTAHPHFHPETVVSGRPAVWVSDRGSGSGQVRDQTRRDETRRGGGGGAGLHSVNKAWSSSSPCPWRSLTSKHQSKTGADIICHQGFPAGEL